MKDGGGRRGRERLQEKRTEETLVEDSSPPANAKWYWNEKAGEKGGIRNRERERGGAVVSARVFPEKELVGRRREREKSGKKRGGDASITLEKRKRRCTEKEPAVQGETRRRRRGKRRLGRLGRKRNQKIDR